MMKENVIVKLSVRVLDCWGYESEIKSEDLVPANIPLDDLVKKFLDSIKVGYVPTGFVTITTL